MGSSRPPTSNTVDQPTTLRELYKQIDWLNALLIVGIPLYGCVQAFWVPLRPATAAFAVAYYFLTGLGITAGYHRLWSHRSYSATTPLRITLALFGAGAAEGSIRWWARGHRAHHRYTDTAQDPYSVRKGLLYAHIGWMLMKPDPKQRRGQADVSDLDDDPIVIWQHRHYLKLVLFMALIFPALICSLCWADWSGGLIYAGILRTFFLQQATFCVNSLAHWFGEQPFDNRHSPRDHFFTALVTFGEGYHNFHHEFPSDFRNAIEWYQYDLTKWAIWLCARAGLAYDLKRFRMNEIEKGRVQQLQKRLDHRAGRLQQEGDEDGDHHLFADLPVVSWDEYQARVREQGEMLVVVAGFVHDVTSFIARHPGGEAMMRSSIGRDATALFNGGIYNHSKKARDILATLRVGVLRGGGEVEIWKKTSS